MSGSSRQGPAEPYASSRLVADALAVLRRGARVTNVASVAYVVYVVALLGAVYLFPYGHFLLEALGRSGVTEVVTHPVSLVVICAAVVATPALAWRLGQVRGPVAPPMLWVRYVVAGPADRALSLRRWWRLLGGAAVSMGGVLGLLLGVTPWSAAITGPLEVLAVTAGGLALGAVAARAWLAGQVVEEGGGYPLRTADGLRRLTEPGLSRQRDRGEGVMGAFLTGRRAALVQELGGRRPRHVGRLRAGRATLVRRDLLAVRRGPGLARAVALLVLGGLGVGVLTPRSAVLGVLGSLVLYRGVVAWAAGLRGQVSPLVPVLGWDERREGAMHLVLPAVAVVLGAALAMVTAVLHGDPGVTPLLAATLVPLHLSVVTWTTHRQLPPLVAVMPQSVVPQVLTWWLLPGVVLLAVPAVVLAVGG